MLLWSKPYTSKHFIFQGQTEDLVAFSCALQWLNKQFNLLVASKLSMRAFPSRIPKRSNKRTKQVSVASEGFTQCILTPGACPPSKRQSCAPISLAQTSIKTIFSFLLFLYLKRTSPKASRLKGSVSGYLATGKTHWSVKICLDRAVLLQIFPTISSISSGKVVLKE